MTEQMAHQQVEEAVSTARDKDVRPWRELDLRVLDLRGAELCAPDYRWRENR